MKSETTPANVARRVAAYVGDVGIAFVAVLALQAALYSVNPLLGGDVATSGIMLHGWVTLTVTVPIVIFFGLSWASRSGATPAMRLMHIRVRTVSGEPVPAARALLRGVVLLLPFEVNHVVLFYPEPIWDSPAPDFRTGFFAVYALVLLYLAVTLRTPMRQGPHDLAAGTIVTRTQSAGSHA